MMYVIIILSGLIPPFAVLFLERHLARQTLREARAIRRDVYKKTMQAKEDIDAHIQAVSNDMALLRQEMQDAIASIPRIDQEALIAQMKSSLGDAFNARIGNEVKQLLHDPQVQAVVEGMDVGVIPPEEMQPLLLAKVMGKAQKKILKFLD